MGGKAFIKKTEVVDFQNITEPINIVTVDEDNVLGLSTPEEVATAIGDGFLKKDPSPDTEQTFIGTLQTRGSFKSFAVSGSSTEVIAQGVKHTNTGSAFSSTVTPSGAFSANRELQIPDLDGVIAVKSQVDSKADLSGGNSFIGNQDVDGNISASGKAFATTPNESGTPTADELIRRDFLESYVSGFVTGIFRLAGNWDASGGTFPTTGTGVGNAVQAGDSYIVTVDGTIGGQVYGVGDSFYAKVNAPGQTSSNWARFEVPTGQASSVLSGIMKLYTSTGTSTDGTMDRNSITTALGSKANDTDVLHTNSTTETKNGSINLDVANGVLMLALQRSGDLVATLGSGSGGSSLFGLLRLFDTVGVENVRMYATGNSWIKGGHLLIGTDTDSGNGEALQVVGEVKMANPTLSTSGVTKGYFDSYQAENTSITTAPTATILNAAYPTAPVLMRVYCSGGSGYSCTKLASGWLIVPGVIST